MKKYILLSFPLLLFLYACNGSGGENIIPIVPEISILEVSPSQVQANVDEIEFTVEYTDGDGDLGTNDDNIRNVFLTDLRINAVSEFRLQQLAPDGAEVPITGTFNLKLPFTIITDSSNSTETATFSLYVVDRAGNQSNTVESPAITINK